MALRAAFSRGSPTSSPSSRARDWQEASTYCVLGGASFTGMMPSFVLLSVGLSVCVCVCVCERESVCVQEFNAQKTVLNQSQ